MSVKKKSKKARPIAVFAITLITVLSIGCGALLFFAMNQEKEEVNLTEQLKNPISNLVDALKSDPGAVTPWQPHTAPESDAMPDRLDSVPESGDGALTMAFAGDILLDDSYTIMMSLHNRQKGIAGCISEELLSEMQEADVCMVNNEFTFTDRGEPLDEKQFTFRANPENVSVLQDMGVDIVSLANNHAYDYGEISLLDTLDTLDNAGIAHAGAGRSLAEAVEAVYYSIDGVTIGIVAATQIERSDNPDTKGAETDSAGVFRCWNPARLLEAVAETKQNCDFVIVYIHWGTEGTAELDWAQTDQAVQIAEAGADLIIGNHPHCLQPIDYMGDVPVVYSLGNFWFNSKTLDTCLVKAVIAQEGLQSLQFLPALQENCTTTMLHGAEKERVLAYMRAISANVNIDSDGYITKK